MQPIDYPAAEWLKVLAWGYLVLCAIAAVGVWVNFAETEVTTRTYSGLYTTKSQTNPIGVAAGFAIFLQGVVVPCLLHVIATMAIDLRRLAQNSADKG